MNRFRKISISAWAIVLLCALSAAFQYGPLKAGEHGGEGQIPIQIDLPEDGEVTVVIEDSSGKRIRNLISQTRLAKGHNTVWWDGTDDLGRNPDAYKHGLYEIPVHLVEPGKYTVRALWHRPLSLRYQMTVYSPGNPPWPTPDGSGGWLADHTPGSAIAFVPKERSPSKQPQIYLGAWISEFGSALAWLDLSGHKLGGRGWIGGNWTGAAYLAYDQGPDADPGTYLYVGSAFGPNINDPDEPVPYSKPEMRLTRLTAKGDVPVAKPIHFDYPPGYAELAHAMGGLAARNGLLVMSQPALDRLVFVDAKKGLPAGTLAIRSPRGVAYTHDGHLLVLSERSLLSLLMNVDPAVVLSRSTIVSDLSDPQGIAVGPDGRIYISDQGDSNQVKVYSQDGQLLKTFGKQGPVQSGKYDPLRMNRPKGIAIDSDGRIWVAEDDFQPKRLSVWNPDGTLRTAFYGRGEGGVLDPQDPTRFFCHGMEFRINLQKRTQSLSRVFYRPANETFLGPSAEFGPIPDYPVRFAGHRYMTNVFEDPITGAGYGFLFLDRGNVVAPVAGMGRAGEWELLKQPEYRSRWPKGISPRDYRFAKPAFFIWSDTNGNGKADPDEVTIRPGLMSGVSVAPDGSFLVSHFAPSAEPSDFGHAVRIRPVHTTDGGVPIYDDKAEALAPSQLFAANGGEQVLIGTEGWLVQTTAPPPFSSFGLGGSQNGVPKWSYPSLWPGQTPSHSAPAPDRPGMLIGTTRILGDLIDYPGTGPLLFLNSNQGQIYIFTQDGLFVTQLFQDVRQGQPWMMAAEHPDELVPNSITLHDENFFPFIGKSVDGSVYLSSGILSVILRLEGLETIKRLPQSQLSVSIADLRLCATALARQQDSKTAEAPKVLKSPIVFGTPPPLDVNPNSLAGVDWVTIDSRGVPAHFHEHTKPYDVKGTVAVYGDSLVAAWRTGDPKLLDNNGSDANSLFHTGGGLDLMLQTDTNANPNRSAAVYGDLRLFVTQVKGLTRAVIFAPKGPSLAGSEKATFHSPISDVTFQAVTDVSDKVKLIASGQGDYEIIIPLRLLGLAVQEGLRIKGDLGVLRGISGQTMQRVYWSNKATAIVSDVPSEAALSPGSWGTFEFFSSPLNH